MSSKFVYRWHYFYYMTLNTLQVNVGTKDFLLIFYELQLDKYILENLDVLMNYYKQYIFKNLLKGVLT